jgi:RND family efflux transporter MFP subunit
VLNYVALNVDPSTGTLTARAELNNADRVILPGMFVRIRVRIDEQEGALLVPDVALGTDQGGRYLFVVGKDNVVEQRAVEVGQHDGQLRVITMGLGADDAVIVNGMVRAAPGQEVDTQMASLAKSTAN